MSSCAFLELLTLLRILSATFDPAPYCSEPRLGNMTGETTSIPEISKDPFSNLAVGKISS